MGLNHFYHLSEVFGFAHYGYAYDETSEVIVTFGKDEHLRIFMWSDPLSAFASSVIASWKLVKEEDKQDYGWLGDTVGMIGEALETELSNYLDYLNGAESV